MKRTSLFLLLLSLVAAVFAGVPEGYYTSARGAKGKGLKTALGRIIADHKRLSYDALWDCYHTTDRRADGKVWDMYSSISNFTFDRDRAGNYKKEGDVYNREHSFPKSWFDDAAPMMTDLMHIVPTDGYVNGRRSNYPFGETSGDRYQSAGGFSKLGSCTLPGYSGIVFEPADEYKGDFARIYFYMATCYEDRIATWSSPMLDGTAYPAFSSWALGMLLRWAAEDPVSEKEIARNDAVYAQQRNRNPYVDYPGLEQYVWGTQTSTAFDPDDYEGAGGGDDNPGGGDEGGGDDNPGGGDEGGDDNPGGEVTGDNVYRLVTSASDLVDGALYLVVNEEAGAALSAASGKVRTPASVTVSGGTITTEVNADGRPTALRLGHSGGHVTLYDTDAGGYLAQTGSKTLATLDDPADTRAQWTVTVSAAGTVIASAHSAYSDYTLQYNASSPRFTAYSSSQKPVVLYRQRPVQTGLDGLETGPARPAAACDLSGRRVARPVRGVYIVGGRKVLVR